MAAGHTYPLAPVWAHPLALTHIVLTRHPPQVPPSAGLDTAPRTTNRGWYRPVPVPPQERACSPVRPSSPATGAPDGPTQRTHPRHQGSEKTPERAQKRRRRQGDHRRQAPQAPNAPASYPRLRFRGSGSAPPHAPDKDAPRAPRHRPHTTRAAPDTGSAHAAPQPLPRTRRSRHRHAHPHPPEAPGRERPPDPPTPPAPAPDADGAEAPPPAAPARPGGPPGCTTPRPAPPRAPTAPAHPNPGSAWSVIALASPTATGPGSFHEHTTSLTSHPPHPFCAISVEPPRSTGPWPVRRSCVHHDLQRRKLQATHSDRRILCSDVNTVGMGRWQRHSSDPRRWRCPRALRCTAPRPDGTT